MEKLEFKPGSVLHTTADTVATLEYVSSGKVEIISPVFHVTAEHGAILGILEHPGEPYAFTYIAKENATVERIPFKRFSDIDKIVHAHEKECDQLVCATAAMTLTILGKYNNIRKRTDNLYKAMIKSYEIYRKICTEHDLEIQSYELAEDSEAFTPEKELPDWLGDYYDQLGIMPQEVRQSFYGTHSSLTTAAILEAAGHADLILRLFSQLEDYSLNFKEKYNSGADLFDLYLNLYQRSSDKGVTDPKLSEEIDAAAETYRKILERTALLPAEQINERYMRYVNGRAAVTGDVPISVVGGSGENGKSIAELAAEAKSAEPSAEDPFAPCVNSLDKILAYTSLDEGEEERFRSLVLEYKELKDKNSSEDKVRRLRVDIAKYFFDVYENAIVTAMESSKQPPVPVRLFLYFGFMDEELLGRDNTLLLLRLLERVEKMCARQEPEEEAEEDEDALPADDRHVFTIYDWLQAIYLGYREPSKNQFDQDYPTFLRTQRQGGFITEEQERRYLGSAREKLRFELDNFFQLGMKIASGRPSVFCPLLSEHSVIRSLSEVLVTAEQVMEGWDKLRAVDYSLFFREALYQAPEYKITRESILIEVIPDMILLPVIGSRGGMWQEITGVRRDTPGRMYLPIFCNEDLGMMQLRLAGEFRWAICKRVQGARWNDVTDHSLTSEYFDYLQFYRKNNELSSDAKEKLKNEISTCKNSFENVFVLDYMQWIRFESEGSPRLNKVVKRILFDHCPFSDAVRLKLGTHPLYTDMINRHNIKAAKQHKVVESRYKKTLDEFGSVPKEIEAFIRYYTL